MTNVLWKKELEGIQRDPLRDAFCECCLTQWTFGASGLYLSWTVQYESCSGSTSISSRNKARSGLMWYWSLVASFKKSCADSPDEIRGSMNSLEMMEAGNVLVHGQSNTPVGFKQSAF